MTDQITRLLDDVQRLDQLEKDVADALQNDNYALAGSCVRKHENLSIDLAPTMGKALRVVLELLSAVEEDPSNKLSFMYGGEPFPATVTTNEVRQAITDVLEVTGVV